MKHILPVLIVVFFITVCTGQMPVAQSLEQPAPGTEEQKLSFTIDDVSLGAQVSGPCVCPLDFKGRIVVCFHWCISCPISTGTFPYINDVVKNYKERGVLIVGFQVRRYPFDVPENDCVWFLDQLKPDFPVVRLGWDCEWPALYLPWIVVFNHEGKAIFAGNIPRKGLEPLLNDALAKAPDFMVGGSYVRLKAAAERIKADRQHAGKYLPAIREAASKTDAPEEQKDASAMLACVEQYFARQIDKADKYARGVVEKMTIYQELASQFEGDILGKKAKALIDEMRAAKNFADEEKACIRLEAARKDIRKLPPPGKYIYDLTRMPYARSTNKPLLQKRESMIAECQKILKSIVDDYPKTAAAAEAQKFRIDLLTWDSDPAYDVTCESLGIRQQLYLGVTLDNEKGNLIKEVVSDSPAEKAGITAGDIITQFNGKPVKNLTDLRNLINSCKANDEIKVIIIRAGKEKEITVKLEAK